MSIHHPRIGRRVPHGAQLVVRLYPRSILWLLMAVAAILVVQGNWVTLGMVIALLAVVIWQTVRTDHLSHLANRRRRR